MQYGVAAAGFGVAALILVACGVGPQDSPAGVVSALYERLAAGEFGKACELVLPETRDALAKSGGNCESAFARLYPADKRKAIEDVAVDEKKVERNGDTARVPESAVTFGGEPSTDAATQTVRRDGKWWVTVG